MAKVLPHPDKFGPKNIVQKKEKKEKKGNEPKISHHTHTEFIMMMISQHLTPASAAVTSQGRGVSR